MGKNVTQKLIESYLVRNQKSDSATARPFDKLRANGFPLPFVVSLSNHQSITE
jgi:hypothetical protein